MRQDSHTLREILEPVVSAMGYELIGVEYHPHRGSALLRLYIDKEGGVNVDDCRQVSHQVSGVLDVEDPIPGHYRLEVSSPGLDRPLFAARDFIRFAGHPVRVQLTLPLNGRRKFTGRLVGVRADQVVLEQEGQELAIPLAAIEKARLIPEF
ncbi:MAG: ribosome maturation factor RimP [Candidatus Competibacteraceae bacterium]